MTIPILTSSEPVGPTGAPLLLLGPSLGTSTILWDAAVPALARHHRVVSWDLPGHGRSAPAVAPFTMAELAEAVSRLIDRYGSGPVAYAGVSMSGCVGLELLLSHPEQVSAAAILCSGAVIAAQEGWWDRATQVRAQSTSSLIIGSAGRWFAPGSIAAHPRHTGLLLHALQDADDESYALCCEALANFDLRARLGEIRVPVMAVWGAYDEVSPERSAREIAEGVRDGRAREIPNASHLAPVDDPDAVVGVLQEFFTGRP
jgi:3-oxoadipate enol-lactonase